MNMKKGRVKSKLIVFVLTLVLLLQSGLIVAFSEGSKDLTDTYDSALNTYGYRPFTEWQSGKTAGITRQQILYAYAVAGETMYFGDSVSNGSVVITKPDGTKITKTVSNTSGGGYIGSVAQEHIGPSYSITNSSGSEVAFGEGGYSPMTLVADITGVYTFEFHSLKATAANPGMTLSQSDTNLISNQGENMVAMWDITVVNTDNIDLPVVKTGRVFANYLCFNTGGNVWNTSQKTKVLTSVIYILTTDGYVYETDFNGIDSYGLVFWGTNRGLINENSNASLYSSAKDKYWKTNANTANLMDALTDDGTADGNPVTFHRPGDTDTRLDQTFKIFFEEPSEDLPSYIKPQARTPEKAENFKFVGDKEGHGYTGLGGYFEFDVTNGTSFQIKLDFSRYNETHGTDFKTLYLANSCTTGHNKIYWDGKDSEGTVIPPGSYGSKNGNNGIDITISIASGEYHFPMLDVENNYYGIKLKLINTPVDASGNGAVLTEKQRTVICYNNLKIIDDNSSDKEHDRTGVAYNQTEGISTASEGQSKFNGRTAYKADISIGDYTAIDLWTYYTGDKFVTLEQMDLESIPDEDGKYYGVVNGFVFYDEVNLGTYNISDNDYTLSGVTVNLKDSDGNVIATTTTDVLGYYYFNTLQYDYVNGTEYTVEVISPNSEYSCTTSNEIQTLTLKGNSATASPVGYHNPSKTYSANLYKAWTYSEEIDTSQPSSVVLTLMGKTADGTVRYLQDFTLNRENSWHINVIDLEKYYNSTDEITYTVTEKPVTPDGVNLSDNYITTYAMNSSASGTVLDFYVTNTKKIGSLTIGKTVTGDNAPASDEFTFEFTVEGGGTFGGVASGSSFTLKNGETKTITGIPYGASYTIKEIQLPGYTPTDAASLTKTGKITGDVNTVNFVNEYTGITTVPFSFTKVDAKNTDTPLRGAEFELYTFTCTDSHTHDDTVIPDTSCWTKYSESVTSKDDGLVDFGDLPSGRYMLIESKAPDGYSRPTGQWEITIDALSSTPIKISAKGSNLPPAFMISTETVGADTITVYKLPNMAKLVLPFSGGSSALTITAVGMAILIVSVFLFCCYTKKKKSIHNKLN